MIPTSIPLFSKAFFCSTTFILFVTALIGLMKGVLVLCDQSGGWEEGPLGSPTEMSWGLRKGRNKMGKSGIASSVGKGSAAVLERESLRKIRQHLARPFPFFHSVNSPPDGIYLHTHCTELFFPSFSQTLPREWASNRIQSSSEEEDGRRFCNGSDNKRAERATTYVMAQASSAPGTDAARHGGSPGVSAARTGEALAALWLPPHPVRVRSRSPIFTSPGSARPPPLAHSPRRFSPPRRWGSIESLEAAAGPACRGAGRGGTLGQDGPGGPPPCPSLPPASCLPQSARRAERCAQPRDAAPPRSAPAGCGERDARRGGGVRAWQGAVRARERGFSGGKARLSMLALLHCFLVFPHSECKGDAFAPNCRWNP